MSPGGEQHKQVEHKIRRLSDQGVAILGKGGDDRLNRLLTKLARDFRHPGGMEFGDIA